MGQIDIMRAAIKADQPLLLKGGPGIGKTAHLRALAKDDGAVVETLIGSAMDPTDFGGLPVPDRDGNVRLAPPSWVRRTRAALDAGRRVWVFLDELSCAPPSVRAPMLRFEHERQIAEVDLRGCRVVGAMNPADSAADGGWLDPATANRWAHVDYKPDLGTWIAGELSGWGRSLDAATGAVAAAVCGFVRHAPGALFAMPKDSEAAGGAWPSPRSLSAGIKMITAAGGLAAECAKEVFAANVGAGTASEFVVWYATQDLPDPEEVLAGRAKMPKRGDSIYTASMAVAAAALQEHRNRDARVNAAWKALATIRDDQALIAGCALLDGAPDSIPQEAVDLGRKIIAVRGKLA